MRLCSFDGSYSVNALCMFKCTDGGMDIDRRKSCLFLNYCYKKSQVNFHFTTKILLLN